MYIQRACRVGFTLHHNNTLAVVGSDMELQGVRVYAERHIQL
jgi:hypothetical protein